MTNNNAKDEITVPLLNNILKEAQSEWLDPNSKYKGYRGLQIDKRGSFGERFFTQTLMKIYPRRLKIEYADGDQGDWDLRFNNYNFEIKTSSIDVNKKFQNEGIKENADYFGILFLGVKPNDLFIRFMLKEDISFEKLHNRKEQGTGSGYKYDFKEKDMIKVLELKDIQLEFEKHFKVVLDKKK